MVKAGHMMKFKVKGEERTLGHMMKFKVKGEERTLHPRRLG